MIRAFLVLSVVLIRLQGRDCGADGVHAEIDIKQLQIQYSGVSVRGMFDALVKLGAEAKTVQTAAEETQKTNQYLQALAAGFNNCAITKAQYFEATQLILPRTKQDVIAIESVRKELAAGRQVTEGRLKALIQSYLGNLKELASLAGLRGDVARIGAEVQSANRKLDDILDRLPKPEAAYAEIDRKLNSKKDEAKTAYAQGYKLMEGYQFAQAVPYFQRALAIVKLPDFYLALAVALRNVPKLDEAEAATRDGLTLILSEPDATADADLSNEFGLILKDKGDLAGAQRYAERALQIDENIYGPDHPSVAVDVDNLGQILQDKGDLTGAQRYTERALQIDEKVYGPDHPKVAIPCSNLGMVLKAKGDLAGAQRYTERALQIDEKVYGPDHPKVAISCSNLGTILQAKGDLAGAQRYAERALQVDEGIYGPDHPSVAIDTSNLAQILQDNGDLAGAQRYAERALQIGEKVYGPDHPKVAIRCSNLGTILQDRGDLAGAQHYTERALQIDEKVYGLNHPNVAIDANNLGQVLKAKGDLTGAQRYTERALQIDEKVYGPDHPSVAIDISNLALMLKARGDLAGARQQMRRALQISEKAYGPDHPTTLALHKALEEMDK
jgi:tetratricopeptide (TPR) repeat protein